MRFEVLKPTDKVKLALFERLVCLAIVYTGWDWYARETYYGGICWVLAKKQFFDKLVQNNFSNIFWDFEPSRWGSDPSLGWPSGSGARSAPGPAWQVCCRGDWRRCSSATAPPPTCPIIGHVVITRGDLFDSPIPDHSVLATATPHVGARKSVKGSALLLVTAREQFKVGTLLSCSGSDSESESR